MLLDVVTWSDQPDGCHRCGRAAGHYVPPYWARHKRICPDCAVTLNRLYDRHGWPPQPLTSG